MARLVRDGSRIQLEDADPYQLELEDMSAAIREGRPPLLGRADALGQGPDDRRPLSVGGGGDPGPVLTVRASDAVDRLA